MPVIAGASSHVLCPVTPAPPRWAPKICTLHACCDWNDVKLSMPIRAHMLLLWTLVE